MVSKTPIGFAIAAAMLNNLERQLQEIQNKSKGDHTQNPEWITTTKKLMKLWRRLHTLPVRGSCIGDGKCFDVMTEPEVISLLAE